MQSLSFAGVDVYCASVLSKKRAQKGPHTLSEEATSADGSVGITRLLALLGRRESILLFLCQSLDERPHQDMAVRTLTMVLLLCGEPSRLPTPTIISLGPWCAT